MTALQRRTFLGGSAALCTGAAGASWAAPAPLRADGAGVRSSGPHEDVARDAGMVWRRLPDGWQDAPFLGNGALTVLVHRATRANALTFALGTGAAPWETVFANADLLFTGTPTAVEWRLDPWDAELSGSVTTTRGGILISALVLREHGALMVSLTPSGDEESASWTVRRAHGAQEEPAWREGRTGRRRFLVASAGGDAAGGGPAGDPGGLVAAHRRWWHTFWTRSLVSVPDKSLQRFYCLQLYKAASTVDLAAPARGHGSPLLIGAGHLELDPVVSRLEGAGASPGGGHRGAAIPGIGARAGRADNPIASSGLPGVWESYLAGMDERVLRDALVPRLRAAVGFYSGFLAEGGGPWLHLPVTRSPNHADVADCTYDLSLLRWAARTLVTATRRLGLADLRLARWEEIATRLVPYHSDESGVLVGAGVRLAASHPRPFHLLWLHPLRERVWERPGDREAMRRSFDHWAGMREAWDRESHVCAASMAAATRAPDEALDHLRRFLDRAGLRGTGLTPNTFYRSASGRDLDVPLTAGRALLDLLVGGGGGVVDVFPAVPGGWRDVSVAGLRTRGAFVVDASRSGGRTDWVRVRADAGGPLVVRHGVEGGVDVRDGHGRRLGWRPKGNGVAEVPLRRGETAVFRRRGAGADIVPRDVPADGSAPPWGSP